MRACGILMPVFSLPGPFGIGTLGKEAFAFVDFLAGAKQTYWQILPIGPTGYGDSPYQSFSAFAGNPYFIDDRLLVEQGFLTQAELPAPQPVGAIDYGALYRERPLPFCSRRGWSSSSQSRGSGRCGPRCKWRWRAASGASTRQSPWPDAWASRRAGCPRAGRRRQRRLAGSRPPGSGGPAHRSGRAPGESTGRWNPG